MNATYIGGPTALFGWNGVRILTDPTFDPPGGKYPTGPVTLEKMMGPTMDADSLGHVDVVLLSHDHHSDNLDHSGREFLKCVPQVITTAEGAARLGGNAIGLTPWQSSEVTAANGEKLKITATPAQHGPADRDRGPVIGFVAAFANQPDEAFYFSGDTVWFDGVAEVAKRFSVRVAVFNMGAARVDVVGPFPLTMTAEGGVKAARAFPDAMIVPLHYEGWTHSESPAKR